MVDQYIFLAAMVGLFPFLVLSIYYNVRQTEKTQTKTKRKNKRRNGCANKAQDSDPTWNRRNVLLSDLNHNISLLSLSQIAASVYLVLNHIPEESWGEVIPNDGTRDGEIKELDDNIAFLKRELLATNDKLSRAVSGGEAAEKDLKGRVGEFSLKLERIQGNTEGLSQSQREKEGRVTELLEESVLRFEELSKSNRMMETDDISEQIERARVNCEWEKVEEAERRLRDLQGDLTQANRQMVGATNRVTSLTALLEKKGKVESHSQMNERLLIKEARNVQLTNLVAQLKTELLVIENNVENARAKLRDSPRHDSVEPTPPVESH